MISLKIIDSYFDSHYTLTNIRRDNIDDKTGAKHSRQICCAADAILLSFAA